MTYYRENICTYSRHGTAKDIFSVVRKSTVCGQVIPGKLLLLKSILFPLYYILKTTLAIPRRCVVLKWKSSSARDVVQSLCYHNHTQIIIRRVSSKLRKKSILVNLNKLENFLKKSFRMSNFIIYRIEIENMMYSY